MTMQGSELREARKTMGFNQQQMANFLDVSPQFVGMMERGEKPISDRTASQIRHRITLQAMLDHMIERQALDMLAIKQMREGGFVMRSNGQDVTEQQIALAQSRVDNLEGVIAKAVEDYGLIDRRG